MYLKLFQRTCVFSDSPYNNSPKFCENKPTIQEHEIKKETNAKTDSEASHFDRFFIPVNHDYGNISIHVSQQTGQY